MQFRSTIWLPQRSHRNSGSGNTNAGSARTGGSVGRLVSSISAVSPDNRLEVGLVELTHPTLPQPLDFTDRCIEVPAELPHVGPAACFRPFPQPAHGSSINFERAREIAAADMKIGYGSLQDPLVESSHAASFISPGRLQLLMGLEVASLVEQPDALACARMQLSLAIFHAGGSITWTGFSPVVKSPRMSRRSFLLLLSLVVVAALIVLASSLHDVRFQPGRPLSMESESANPILLPTLQVPSTTPLWKILLFWALAVINLVMFFWLLPPEVRKRLLRQVLRIAVGFLALLLALKYQLIKLPEIGGEPAVGPGPVGSGPAAGSEAYAFHPPQMSPWMVYLASLAAILFVFLVLVLIYRRWIRPRLRRASPLGAIADIAHASLRELATGRNWGDVIIECYANMNSAVSARRGLLRPDSATPREFAERLTRAGLPADAVTRLTGLFESVRYGGHAGSEADIRAATDCLNTIIGACGGAA